MSNLFDSLLTEKYRPKTLDDLILSKENRDTFAKMIETKEIPHLLLCGNPGTGKTSLAKVLANSLEGSYRYINASDERGIDAIRDKVIPFAQTRSIDGRIKIIILDEADGLTGDSQRALRNIIEEHSDNLRFILTANYKSKIIEPIRSRTILYELVPPLDEVLKRVVNIIKSEGIEVSKEQIPLLQDLINKCFPDIRQSINFIQKYSKDKKLQILKEFSSSFFAREVIKKLFQVRNIIEIREFIIQNEPEFNNDYHSLLKGMFEEFYKFEMEDVKKATVLINIGEHLYKHQFVMDTEINAFCCIMQIKNLL